MKFIHANGIKLAYIEAHRESPAEFAGKVARTLRVG